MKKNFITRLGLIVSLIIIMLTGYGGLCKRSSSSDSANVGSSGAPSVSSTSPTSNATDVPITTTINAVFDENIDPLTVISTTFLVNNSGASITGTVLGASANVTFTPSSSLSLLTTYTATLTTGVTDATGNALEANYVWKFTTRDGAWVTAGLIETDNVGAASAVQVTVGPNNNAIAVWNQSDGTRNNIWANRYISGTGWSTAELIETDNSGNALGQQVAIDNDNNAIAVWRQSDGTRNNIWSNRYISGTGWSTAELIETDNSGSAWEPQIAIDSNNNAIAVWYQSDGTRNNIWSNRYTAVSGTWGTAELIETDNAGNTWEPQVAIDSNNNAIAIWQQSDGIRWNIWANRYISGTGWGSAELIEADNSGGAFWPQVAIGPNNDAIAVWQQSDGTRDNIWTNRYDAVSGTGWGSAELLETDNTGAAAEPQVAIDSDNNAIVVWYQDDGTRDNIWSARYITSTGWGTPQLIETNDTGYAMAPQVAIDSNNNAVAVWYQFDGTQNDIWAARYITNTGWATPALIETDNSGNAWEVQVTMDSNNNAIAVWEQSDGTRNNIWSNRFKYE